MSLKCGIVGLPNIGKSTLFNTITNSNVSAENFAFCTIDPNLGVTKVPDFRLYSLSKIVNPQKIIANSVEFVDIAGLVKGANCGEGLGNKFLSHIKEVNVIIHLIRCFEDPTIKHVHDKIDPVYDKEIIDQELQLRDLETIEKFLQKSKKFKTASLGLLQLLEKEISSGINARDIGISKDEVESLKDLALLTLKPVIYVANIDEMTLINGSSNSLTQVLNNLITSEKKNAIPICIKVESEISKLTDDSKQSFLNEYKLEKSALDLLINEAYKELNLITYFTVGEKEVRAWPIKKGSLAPEAAGVIHSDMQRGFIKAEIIKFQDFLQYESEKKCKIAGKVCIEGKNYVVQDGDIVTFRFNI